MSVWKASAIVEPDSWSVSSGSDHDVPTSENTNFSLSSCPHGLDLAHFWVEKPPDTARKYGVPNSGHTFSSRSDKLDEKLVRRTSCKDCVDAFHVVEHIRPGICDIC